MNEHEREILKREILNALADAFVKLSDAVNAHRANEPVLVDGGGPEAHQFNEGDISELEDFDKARYDWLMELSLIIDEHVAEVT